MKLSCQVLHNTHKPDGDVVIEEVIEEANIELTNIYKEGSDLQLLGVNPNQDGVPPVLSRKPSVRRTTSTISTQ